MTESLGVGLSSRQNHQHHHGYYDRVDGSVFIIVVHDNKYLSYYFTEVRLVGVVGVRDVRVDLSVAHWQ